MKFGSSRLEAPDGPVVLRDYQIECVEEAEKRNVLCVLPTNTGKTVIAAELIACAALHPPRLAPG